MLINTYRQKEQLFRQLQKELQELEARDDLKKELEFKSAIEEVMARFDKTERELVQLFSNESAAATGDEPKTRRKRTARKYKNPNTGEIIEVRGGRQRNYQSWIQLYGKDVVKSWAI
ncbi:H-NS histone family protein [Oceanospirillum multiglobuliferum]|uniref:MvaT DNA-binding domain-containing protein n=1 Tax=Oceanospirillum multiglobuliferum TaxID=64969 RepID=A0A1T4R4H5_9GAMM|nr:histone-like nucleoid-structuring protein, MvaT/MvaU family [Oceanospirillum multiglobuliferum]OPX55233.1 hypothetical protein BTE48_09870 [Oceanospirillum multiglobuliferum]SKA10974.1 H-NS histone family protein [Oceanospirillum multiglobuliferum]